MAIHIYKIIGNNGTEIIPEETGNLPVFKANEFAEINGVEYKILRVVKALRSGAKQFIYQVEIAPPVRDTKSKIQTAINILRSI